MGTVKRVLLVLVAFGVANVAAFVTLSSLGVERGEWRYALTVGVIVAVVGAVWKLTAPKRQPRNSN